MSEVDKNKETFSKFLAATTALDLDLLDKLLAEDLEHIVPGTCFVSRSYTKSEFIDGAKGVIECVQESIQFDIQTLTAEDDRVSCIAQ